eukprot:SAG11_NODE_37126_length_258_cov_0.874214_1_plen_48_part_10
MCQYCTVCFFFKKLNGFSAKVVPAINRLHHMGAARRETSKTGLTSENA